MTEERAQGNSSGSPQAEPDLVALIKRMQMQLLFLEKKIDILINQSSGKPSRDKHFSKPARSFDRPNRPYSRERSDASGEKRFDRGRRFEKSPDGDNRGFDRKKKAYGGPGGGGYGSDRKFVRRDDGPRKGFDSKKKPFRFKKKSFR